jgi:hypothetical protein
LQALPMSLYRRSVDYQRNPSKNKARKLVTSASTGVNVDGNLSMNTIRASAADVIFATASTYCVEWLTARHTLLHHYAMVIASLCPSIAELGPPPTARIKDR